MKIANAPEFVASKMGKFVELVKPGNIAYILVEEQVIKKLLENFSSHRLKFKIIGENFSDIIEDRISINEGAGLLYRIEL